MMDSYKSRFGNAGIERFNEAVLKVKSGEITYRQAASTLGITYYEFVALLDEAGAFGA